MKTLKNIAAAFALIIILFAGCKNPADDIEIIVNTDIFKSPMLIQFVNAKDGVEGPKSFTVDITGPDANLVRTATGGKVFKTAEGILNLVLDRDANPTPTTPVKFTLIANAAGFAPTYQDVVITSITDPTVYKVIMTEYANPTAGSGSVVATKAITSGTTSTDLNFTTATNAEMAQKSVITIPTGTGLLDASGASVGGSQLEARVVYSGYAADGTFSNLPGGGFAANLIGTNGQQVPEGAYLNPVGSVSINMSAGGKEVKFFTKPVSVDMEINGSIINPNTDQIIKENDIIPQWSLNTETGQWKSEGNAAIVRNTQGILVARMTINHLTDWVLAFSSPGFICTSSITINRTSDAEDETFFFTNNLSRNFTSSGNLIMKKGEKTKTFSGNVMQAGNFVITVTAGSDKYTQKSIESPRKASIDFCGKVSTFNFVDKPDIVGVDVDIKLKCTTKDILTGINSFMTITPIGTNADKASPFSFYLSKGIGSSSFVNGVTYKISAIFEGKVYTSQFTANKNNFVLPSGFDLTGEVVYNPTTNRLKIVGQVTKSCN